MARNRSQQTADVMVGTEHGAAFRQNPANVSKPYTVEKSRGLMAWTS